MAGKKKIKPASTPKTQDHFGFTEVGEDARQGFVNQVFDSVAGKYDLMNDAMSGGFHRLWKDHLINRLRPWGGMKLLDVAGGTGDVALRFLKALKNKGALKGKPATVCDINPQMLEVGRGRAIDKGFWENLEWVTGNAEALPFPDESFEATTIAFGIRNVTHLDKAISEAYRILKPGGRYLVLEFSSVPSPLMRQVYDWYSFHMIPKMGKAITGDEASYQYLAESIRKFPPPEVFAGFMKEAGFTRIKTDPLAGGIVTLYSGWKI
ncbi:MAG: bifunctional demethylmenaquinone methyltransferase/2-methoxy-6-polyprenyl-1,4-benzoquinol methylase UbiE [Sphingomonadales bacterium]